MQPKPLKTIEIILAIIVIVGAGWWLASGKKQVAQPTPSVQSCNPQFEDYSVVENFSGAPAPVNFSTDPDAREFRTVISNAEKAGPNFAGHYTVATWGCGTACQRFAIVNSKTGAVIEFPNGSYLDDFIFLGADSNVGIVYDYRIDSRLFIVGPPREFLRDPEFLKSNPDLDWKNWKVNYLELNDDRLQLVCRGNYL